jgi:hypothetical protein
VRVYGFLRCAQLPPRASALEALNARPCGKECPDVEWAGSYRFNERFANQIEDFALNAGGSLALVSQTRQAADGALAMSQTHPVAMCELG